MKKRLLFLLFISPVLFLFTGCDNFLQEEDDEPEDVTIKERIQMLEDDLNDGDYNNVYKNFHPEMISYNSYKDGSAINTGVLDESYASFSFSDPIVSNITTINGTFNSENGPNGTYSGTMKEDGTDNWKILSITIISTTYRGLSF